MECEEAVSYGVYEMSTTFTLKCCIMLPYLFINSLYNIAVTVVNGI